MKERRKSWIMVGGLSIASFIILGSTISTVGIFLLPLTKEFSWNSKQSSVVAATFVLSLQLVSPAVGWLLDRIKAHVVMTIGALLTVTGYLWASSAHDLFTLSTAMALSGAGVGASTYLPCTVLATQWVEMRRGLAIAIVVGASSLGGAVLLPVVEHLISAYGWRTSMQCIASFIFICTTPLFLLLIRQPTNIGGMQAAEQNELPGLEVREALGSKDYWSLAVMMVLTSVGFMGVYFHIVPFLVDQGFSSRGASLIYAATNVTSFVGFIAVGMFADRFSAKRTLLVSLLVNALGIFMLPAAGYSSLSIGAAIAFVLLWGATLGAPSQLIPILLMESVGPRRFSTLFGINTLLAGLALSVGPVVTGAIRDATASYVRAFEVCASPMIIALIPMLLVRCVKEFDFHIRNDGSSTIAVSE